MTAYRLAILALCAAALLTHSFAVAVLITAAILLTAYAVTTPAYAVATPRRPLPPPARAAATDSIEAAQREYIAGGLSLIALLSELDDLVPLEQKALTAATQRRREERLDAAAEPEEPPRGDPGPHGPTGEEGPQSPTAPARSFYARPTARDTAAVARAVNAYRRAQSPSIVVQIAQSMVGTSEQLGEAVLNAAKALERR